MRMIMIIVAAVLVVGGGAGAYFYFTQQANAAIDPAADVAAGGHAGKGGDKHAAKEAKHDKKDAHAKSEFVELDPLILPIVDNNGLSQTVSVVIALEVATPEAAAEVKGMSPKLKDAYIQDMYGALSEHAALKGGVLQVGQLKERLNKVTTDVMGENVVDDVLLQVVQQRPI